jgi:hypothetical protein
MATETKTRTEDASAGAPIPPSPPNSPPQPSSSRKRPVDGKTFYGYLYKKDKTTTPLLDALLRAIGKYIVRPLPTST